MRDRVTLVLVVFIFVIILPLSGCSQLFGGTEDALDTDAIVQTAVAQTQAALQQPGATGEVIIIEPTLTQAGAVPEIPSETIAPEATSTPTITLTLTETLTPTLSVPQVHVDVNTNCRLGPGTIYEIVGSLLVNQDAEIVGRYQGADYWIIDNPNGSGVCWLWGNYATPEGPVENLPYFTPPPTPTPTLTPTPEIDWTGVWSTTYGPTGGPYYDIAVTLIQTGATVTGSYTFLTFPYTLSGTLSADYLTLSAEWNNGTTTGPFLWHWLNPNQFNGNEDSGNNMWCGYRNAAGNPSPCMYP